MANTKKLMDLFTSFYGVDPMYYGVEAQPLIDYLIAHGVTIGKATKAKPRKRKRHAISIETMLAMEKIGQQAHGGAK